MTINFRNRRRAINDCTHEETVRTETAGMSREVCESCGHVSVGFVADHRAHIETQDSAETAVGDRRQVDIHAPSPNGNTTTGTNRPR